MNGAEHLSDHTKAEIMGGVLRKFMMDDEETYTRIDAGVRDGGELVLDGRVHLTDIEMAVVMDTTGLRPE